MQLLPELREHMMALSFLVLRSPFTGGRVCVCFCGFLSVSALALWQRPGFCMKFHHTLYTHKHTWALSIHALLQSGGARCIRSRAIVLPIGDQMYRWDVCLWWGCLNHLLLFRQKQQSQLLQALLTTERGPQQTSVVGCVRTGWITGCCQASQRGRNDDR